MKDKDSSIKGFYTHEKFGLVPIGWDVVKLGSSFDFFPTASYSRALLSENGDCGYIHYGDIHTRFDRFIDAETDTLPCISEDMAKRYTPIIDGDLIISDASEDYEGVGKSVEVINVGEKVIISGLHTLHLRVKNNEFIKGFKGYILNQEKVRNSILRIATGIKVYSVSKTELKKIYLPKPPEDEQIQITNILSLVDSAIQSTQNSIKAAEKLKKGLMQNLLTGKLKPDGTWRNENEFTYNEKVGFYPKEWCCDRFKEFSVLQRGKDLTDNEVINGCIPVVKSNGIQIYHNDFICEPPGVVTGRSGTIGKAFYISERFWPHNTTLYVKDFKGNHPKFIFYFIQKMKFDRYYAGTTVPTLNRNDIHRIKVAIPNDIEEQIAISNKIDSVDDVITSKFIKLKSLQRLKKSLMQNLLTGKVRVDINEIKNVLTQQAI